MALLLLCVLAFAGFARFSLLPHAKAQGTQSKTKNKRQRAVGYFSEAVEADRDRG